MNSKIWLSTGLVCAMATILGGAFWLGSIGQQVGPAMKTRRASKGLALLKREGRHLKDARWEELLRRNFAPWRGRPEPMPPSLRQRVKSALGHGDLHLQFDEAQHVGAAEGDAWLIAGEGIACLARAKVAAVACDTVGRTVRYGLSLGTYKMRGNKYSRRPRFQLLAVFPDWVASVALRTKRDLQIPVVHNLIAYSANQPIRLRHLASN